MYTKQEASIIKQSFWTAFGRYMNPVPGADGEKISWINYKTGVKNIFFKMDATRTEASLSIILNHTDAAERQEAFEKWVQLKTIFTDEVGSDWDWKENTMDDAGREISMIRKTLPDVNVFAQHDWPGIISFLKPNMMALDAFWQNVKPIFEKDMF